MIAWMVDMLDNQIINDEKVEENETKKKKKMRENFPLKKD